VEDAKCDIVLSFFCKWYLGVPLWRWASEPYLKSMRWKIVCRCVQRFVWQFLLFPRSRCILFAKENLQCKMWNDVSFFFEFSWYVECKYAEGSVHYTLVLYNAHALMSILCIKPGSRYSSPVTNVILCFCC